MNAQMRKESQRVLKQLNYDNMVFKTYRRDSPKFMKISEKDNDLMFGKNLAPQDYGLIVHALGRTLSTKECVDIIVTARHHKSIANLFNLPVSFEITLWFFRMRINSKLTEKEFAQKYQISQAKLSKMETGKQPVDIDLFQKVLKSHHKSFTIK